MVFPVKKKEMSGFQMVHCSVWHLLSYHLLGHFYQAVSFFLQSFVLDD